MTSLLGADPAGLVAVVLRHAVEAFPRRADRSLDALAADLAARLVPAGARLVVLDVGGDHPGASAATGPDAAGLDRAGGAAVPIHLDGQAMGTLAVYGPPGVEVDAAEFAALRQLAGLAAMLIAAADGTAVRGQWTVQAQEDERARLAADIHDGIAQRLVSLSFHLDAASRAIESDPPFAVEQVARAQELAQLAAAETRAAIGGLRPPVLDDLGLQLALLGLARTVGAVPVDTARVRCRHRMPDAVQTALYRIAQEALHNVVRHAQAAQAVLALECSPHEVRLTITDDGVGLPPTSAADLGVGLSAIRQRAAAVGASLAVRSRPDAGTTIQVVLTPGHPPGDLDARADRGDDQPGSASR